MSPPGTQPISTLLRNYRLEASLSQEELAERSGLSARAISDLERGLSRSPRPETVRMLSDALKLRDDQRTTLLVAAHPELGTVPTIQGPIAAPEAAVKSLPVPPTRLIGRDQDAERLLSFLLNQGDRLITLTGAGGVGKTRLAIEVVRRAASSFDNDVVFVDLAPIGDANQVGPALGWALGLRESGERSMSETICTALMARHLLLLIDNFEQVIDAATLVAQLLSAAPALHVIVTSREALHIRGEREFVVEPLGLHAYEGTDPDSIGQMPAVELFVQTARLVRPSFELTTDNARDVIAVCRRLDGLPLAIELAATRIKHLTPAALLDQLDKSLVFLASGPRDLPVHQRTLRDAIAWSYDLLTGREQELLRVMGIFAGGATLDAISTLCDLLHGQRDDYLERLSSLVDKSLLRATETDGDGVQFSVLELVREFAIDQLHAAGEFECVQQSHARYFLEYAESRGPHHFIHLQGFDRHENIDREINNIRAALAWHSSQEDSESMATFACVLWQYFYLRGLFREGYALCLRAVELINAQPVDGETHVVVLLSTGIAASVLGEATDAVEFAKESVRLARELPTPARVLPWALNASVIPLRDSRQLDEAIDAAEESLALETWTEDAYFRPFARYHLGRLAYLQNDFERAIVLLEESRELIEALGPTETELYTVNTLAAVHVRVGNDLEAARLLRVGRALVRRHGYAGFWFDSSVLLAEQCGHLETAATLLGYYTTYYASIGVEELPIDPRLDAAITRLTSVMGQEGFDVAVRNGSLLKFDEAQTVVMTMLSEIERNVSASSARKTRADSELK